MKTTIIIGGGPAGLAAAKHAKLSGENVLLFEKDKLGGTCLHRGCIPSKALIEEASNIQNAQKYISQSKLEYNLAKILEDKQTVVNKIEKSIIAEFSRANIEWINEEVENIIQNDMEIFVYTNKQKYICNKLILATGSSPITMPEYPIDGKYFINSDQALSPSNIPESLLVVGAGAIGLELGQLYNMLGSKVTIIEALPQILPALDPEVSSTVIRALKSPSLDIKAATTIEKLTIQNDKITALLNTPKTTISCEFNQVLFAIGRKPNIELAQKLHLQLTDKNRIQTDNCYQTSALEIYAIGDITEGPMLAHKAEKDAESCYFCKPPLNHYLIPSIIYTHPEIAFVGQKRPNTESITKPLRSNARSLTAQYEQGLFKLDINPNKEIIRAQIIAPNASEIILPALFSIQHRIQPEQWNELCFPHPTLSELFQDLTKTIQPKPERKFKRYNITKDITINGVPAVLKNLSYQGLFAISSTDYKTNTVVKINFQIETLNYIEFTAIVRRCDIAGEYFAVGIEFYPTHEERNTTLEILINTFLAKYSKQSTNIPH